MEPFGARLKREREQRKITLDDIALSTKIGARFLAALEEEQFDRLPGGIFNKSFVRAYARYLGIDETQAVADYVAASAETLPESPPEETVDLAAMAAQSKRTDRNAGGTIPWGGFAIALLIIAFTFAVWGFYSREKRVRPARAVLPAVVARGSAPDSPTVTAAAAPEPAPPETAGESARPAAGPSGTEPPPAPSGSAAPGPAAVPAAPPAAPVASPGFFLVQIKAREDSWVSIVADGKPVMQETLSPAAEKSVEARSQVVVKTGNVGALDILFNGKQLPPQGNFSQVKTLTFDSNGLRAEAAQTEPRDR